MNELSITKSHIVYKKLMQAIEEAGLSPEEFPEFMTRTLAELKTLRAALKKRSSESETRQDDLTLLGEFLKATYSGYLKADVPMKQMYIDYMIFAESRAVSRPKFKKLLIDFGLPVRQGNGGALHVYSIQVIDQIMAKNSKPETDSDEEWEL